MKKKKSKTKAPAKKPKAKPKKAPAPRAKSAKKSAAKKSALPKPAPRKSAGKAKAKTPSSSRAKAPKPAGQPVANAARELIEVEQELVAGRGNQALADRWLSLAQRVLGGAKGDNPRRSIRLPAGVKVRLGIRKGEFLCELLDLSQLGATVSGAVMSFVNIGETVELRGVERDGLKQAIGILYDVVRVDTRSSPPVVGLQLRGDNDAASHQRYFEAIYYPLYRAYLERKALG